MTASSKKSRIERIIFAVVVDGKHRAFFSREVDAKEWGRQEFAHCFFHVQSEAVLDDVPYASSGGDNEIEIVERCAKIAQPWAGFWLDDNSTDADRPLTDKPCDRDELCGDDYCNRKDRIDYSGLPAPSNVAAFTRPTGYVYYPPYLSINRVAPIHGEDIEVMVRGQETNGGEGSNARIRLTEFELVRLLEEALKNIKRVSR